MIGIRRQHALTILFALVLCLPLISFAAQWPGQIVPKECTGTNCTCAQLIQLANNILTIAVYIAVFASAVLFAWAGWKMMTGHTMGKSGDISEAKQVLWNVIIGLIVILVAYLLVDTIMKTLSTLSIWNTLVCPAGITPTS